MAWIRNESGLYVPDGDVPRLGPAEPKLRQTEVRSVRLQAQAALLAIVIIGIPTLYILIATYLAQSEMDASDADTNRVEQQRFVERYASQVALWLVIDEHTGTARLSIQNRSPVPLSEVRIRMRRILEIGHHVTWAKEYHDAYDTFSVEAPIPPCSSMNLALSRRFVPPAAPGLKLDLLFDDELQVSFSDGQRTWMRSRSSLRACLMWS